MPTVNVRTMLEDAALAVTAATPTTAVMKAGAFEVAKITVSSADAGTLKLCVGATKVLLGTLVADTMYVFENIDLFDGSTYELEHSATTTLRVIVRFYKIGPTV